MTRSPEASGAGRAIHFNLLFFKEKNKRISVAIPHAAAVKSGAFFISNFLLK